MMLCARGNCRWIYDKIPEKSDEFMEVSKKRTATLSRSDARKRQKKTMG